MNIDFTQAIDYKDAVVETLNDFRCDKKAEELHAQATDLWQINGINIYFDASSSRKQRKLDEFVISESLGRRSDLSNSDQLKNDFFPSLYGMVPLVTALILQ